ncbi:PREDICTED: uncharacterized protein LOC106743266 [Dinoponera quadriceps]|uniref:Uncharacterized protein LOC106743266 n=1 Tax=Dinoponera quadriceps TaxID=609295 RepID=A0A6P3X299_DINQU|nr:PREDICTED: uncharacterized protein LOC106743266 [Dinoponera quadriceps]
MRCTFRWVLLFLLGAVTRAYVTQKKFIEVHEMDSKELSPMDQLAPVDPALHAFPKTPTVPLLPNCMKRGYLRDPFNCSKFYRCDYDHAVPKAFYCQSGLIFNTLTESCDHPQYVQC